MTAKKAPKAKPLTALQQAERKAANMEYAIYDTYNNFDELFALLRLYKDFIESPNYNKYTAKNALNGIFTNAISMQTSLMDQAGLEY
jgi:hypothetical protein